MPIQFWDGELYEPIKQDRTVPAGARIDARNLVINHLRIGADYDKRRSVGGTPPYTQCVYSGVDYNLHE